jgi:hypothetical protein
MVLYWNHWSGLPATDFQQEAAMATATKPTKFEVRSWMQQRQSTPTPPPSPDQIRRELGWNLIPSNTPH